MIYVACENANFIWKPSQVRDFDRLWHEGYRDITQLARYFKRPPHDIAFLIWDRNHQSFEPIQNHTDPPKKLRVPSDSAAVLKSRGRNVKGAKGHERTSSKANVR